MHAIKCANSSNYVFVTFSPKRPKTVSAVLSGSHLK